LRGALQRSHGGKIVEDIDVLAKFFTKLLEMEREIASDKAIEALNSSPVHSDSEAEAQRMETAALSQSGAGNVTARDAVPGISVLPVILVSDTDDEAPIGKRQRKEAVLIKVEGREKVRVSKRIGHCF
jgi:hypothetical protein